MIKTFRQVYCRMRGTFCHWLIQQSMNHVSKGRFWGALKWDYCVFKKILNKGPYFPPSFQCLIVKVGNLFSPKEIICILQGFPKNMTKYLLQWTSSPSVLTLLVDSKIYRVWWWCTIIHIHDIKSSGSQSIIYVLVQLVILRKK